jgi:quercetin dioxygenase-like cupin family protein
VVQFHPAGSRATEAAPAEYFTGAVFLDPLITAPNPSRLRGLSVTFTPGARTHWHTHPLGQTIIVTAGAGRFQVAGGPVQVLRPGDVVYFAPGEKHWHGAAPETAMTHIALQEAFEGETAHWLEPVSAEDYHAAPQN